MKMVLSPLLVATALVACGSPQISSTRSTPGSAAGSVSEVVLVSEVKWEDLNPARGDKSPKAGTLWGDRKGTGPTGFLLRPTDGFKSPPHIHNVSYRGVVIRGLIHNDDPKAANMWLPAGSFWTQPKGEVHITAAKGSDTLAYIEIEKGPYLVLAPAKGFDSGERPVNVDKTNVVWLDASNITWVTQRGTSAAAKGPKVAFLWGTPQANRLSGTLVKLPAGFSGTLRNQGSTFRAVVIQGRSRYRQPGKTAVKTLDPGSYFSSQGRAAHRVSCDAGADCILYVRMQGTLHVTPTRHR